MPAQCPPSISPPTPTQIYNQEELLRKNLEANPENKVVLRSSMRDRSTSLVSRQRMRANLLAKHEAIIEEIAMLGPIIRLADYILCDALIKVGVVLRCTRSGIGGVGRMDLHIRQLQYERCLVHLMLAGYTHVATALLSRARNYLARLRAPD